MNATEFAYWLQGFAEIQEVSSKDAEGLTPEQWQVVKDHLKLVFTNVTKDKNKPTDPTSVPLKPSLGINLPHPLQYNPLLDVRTYC